MKFTFECDRRVMISTHEMGTGGISIIFLTVTRRFCIFRSWLTHQWLHTDVSLITALPSSHWMTRTNLARSFILLRYSRLFFIFYIALLVYACIPVTREPRHVTKPCSNQTFFDAIFFSMPGVCFCFVYSVVTLKVPPTRSTIALEHRLGYSNSNSLNYHHLC